MTPDKIRQIVMDKDAGPKATAVMIKRVKRLPYRLETERDRIRSGLLRVQAFEREFQWEKAAYEVERIRGALERFNAIFEEMVEIVANDINIERSIEKLDATVKRRRSKLDKMLGARNA